MADRRLFLKSIAALTAGLTVPAALPAKEKSVDQDRLGKILPKRKLGKTNEWVTMLGVGGFHIGWTTEHDAREVIDAALEGGVRFFDTAESYDTGRSEERYGKYLTPQYRDLIFLTSKSTGKDAGTVQEHLEGTLKRLKTDHLDLYQVHAVETPDDVDGRIHEGVLKVMMKAKQEGKTRYIGFTGHQNPHAHMRMLEQTKTNDIFDVVLMPVNVLDQSYFSFIQNVMPVALERNMGITSIKSLADGRFFANKPQAKWNTDDPVIPNYLSIKEAMYFVWSLPVSVLISGNENATLMREKIELARNFTALTQAQRTALAEKVKNIAMKGTVEYFKQKQA
jgi:predicted aldo/keto reductase-like oxidoreductase